MNANGIPAIARGLEIRPFDEYAAMARELGFNMLYDHDPAAFTVAIRLEPKTDEARRAIVKASGDETVDGIEVTTVYDKASAEMRAHGVEPPPRENEAKAALISRQDTALEALRMANKAIKEWRAGR